MRDVSPQCSVNSFYFVELFSGSGKLSAAMRKRGFKIFPVDHEFNSHKPAVSTISLNLQEAKAQRTVEEMIQQSKPAAVHLGLPCGTCSRAREKPLPEHLCKSFKDPPPLRDAANLLGFKHLTGTNLAKVEAANELYRWGVKILFICYQSNIRISIENPERSWLWGILTMLVKEYNDSDFLFWFSQLDRVTFNTCMHAGTRAKNTRLLSTPGLYSSLAATCDNGHEHEPWRIRQVATGLTYDTAAEAEYPTLLCQRMADLLAASVHLPQVPEDIAMSKQARHILANHVKQAPPLVPEFSPIIETTNEPSDPGYRLLTSQLQGATTEMDKLDEDYNNEHLGPRTTIRQWSTRWRKKEGQKDVQSGGAENASRISRTSQEDRAPNVTSKGDT